MDDRSWMYRDSSERLCKMNYCNGFQGFINYTLSNKINISGENIRCPCKSFKNKKFIDSDVVTMHLLQKWFMNRYLCWFTHGELYVYHETMVKRMVGSTSSSNNVNKVADNNSNPYRNMDAMKMNQGCASQYPKVDKEPNADAIGFFDLLKDSDESLWDGCTNHNKLLVITHVFTSQIIGWVRLVTTRLLNK